MLQSQVEALFAHPKPSNSTDDFAVFERFIGALNAGEIRAAAPDPASPTGWRVNPWVKQGILLGFRMGTIVDMSIDVTKQPFLDKSTFPVKQFSPANDVRIVPGGSSIRTGAYVGKSVVCMPPMYINVGAFVDEGTTVDSHALIGSCAQIGKKCHISAGVQIGGVLEPVGALPVIIEDEVLAGGQSGVYEGVIVKRRAVLGTGTILNASTPVYDIVKDQILSATEDHAARHSRRRRCGPRLPRHKPRRRAQMGPKPLHSRDREIPRRKNRRTHPARRPDPLVG